MELILLQDQVKTLGFQQATATSISLGIDDLLTIPSKGCATFGKHQKLYVPSDPPPPFYTTI